MPLDASGIQGVEETIRRYIDGYAKEDIDLIKSILSPTVQGFGSGPDEVIRNREESLDQIRRDLDQCESVSIRMDDMRVHGTPPVASLMATCRFTVTAGGETVTLAGRYTAVPQKADDRWLIEQIHYSLPAAGQHEGRSYPGA
ncbi:MAG: nuclear transport factor 2 family protein [Methanomicrobiales archaeon]